MRGVHAVKVVQQRRKKQQESRKLFDKQKIFLITKLKHTGLSDKSMPKGKFLRFQLQLKKQRRAYLIKLWGITLLVAALLISLALFFNQIIVNIEL